MAIVRCSKCGELMSTLDASCSKCGTLLPSAIDLLMSEQDGKKGARSRGAAWSHDVKVALCTGLGTMGLIAVVLVVLRNPPAPPASHLGSLWWPGDRAEQVVIYSSEHANVAPSLDVLHHWQDLGQACLADAGTRVELLSDPQANFSDHVSVVPMAGNCIGFHGWVSSYAWHDDTP